MSNITFAILAYNEEKRIPYVIKNLIKYGEIIILDGGSTDRTKELAESLGAKFYSRPESTQPFVETAKNFDFLKSIIKTDWIYWGYADNHIPKKTLEKMMEVSDQKREALKIKAVYAPLYTYLWGNTDHYAQKSYIPALYHINFIDFTNERIHSMGDFTGKSSEKLMLPNNDEYSIKHFSVYDMRKFVMGHLKYAETEAAQKFAAGTRFSIFKMFAAMIRYMWIYGKQSIRNGKLGIIIILHYAFFRLMAYTKLYELENNITIENTEKKYNALREKMLEDFS